MNRDELAESLRIGFKAMIVEADEWRPLADYIISLLDVRLHENTQCNPVTLIDLPDSPTIHLPDEESSNKRKEAFAEWMTRGSIYKGHKNNE